jgi:superfamily II DNA or RNA helicase
MARAKTWAHVINHCRAAGSKVLGLSATPDRHDGKALGALFDVLVPGPSMRWLIDQGHLSDYVAYAPSAPDRSALHSLGGDFRADEAEQAMSKPTITGCAIEHYRQHADGTRAICYCVSIEHSKRVAEAFSAAGIPAAHIDGTTPADEQQRVIHALADGAVRVLCNVELITTGFDLGAQVGRDVPIETCVVLRPTRSVALHLQMLGRALRRKPQPAVILDHAGNLMALGLPDDERQWSLDGRETRGKAREQSEFPVRQCEQCYAVHKPAPVCPRCGHVYPVQSRAIDEVDGELERIERGSVTAVKPGRSLASLIAEGRARGMRNPYAWARWQMRKVEVAA